MQNRFIGEIYKLRMLTARIMHWRVLQKKDNLCVLCEPSKATLWCYTSIFDDIISILNQRRVGTQWQLSGPVHDNQNRPMAVLTFKINQINWIGRIYCNFTACQNCQIENMFCLVQKHKLLKCFVQLESMAKF